MDYNSLYNEEYYRTSCGDIPYTDPLFLPFFESVAELIINSMNPASVLDVGCAMGHLVKALRDRGVEAYGIDVSEYAISQVHESIRNFCKVSSAVESIPEGFPQHYDLVVTIEVAEHLYEEDAQTFIDNLCKCGDTVIFSSTSTDFTEKTHYNVQQPEYWAKRFAKCGFYRNLDIDLHALSADAVQFTRKEYELTRLIEDYERTIRMQRLEKDQHIQSLTRSLQESQEANRALILERNNNQEEVLRLSGELDTVQLETSRLTRELETVHMEASRLNGSLNELRLKASRQYDELTDNQNQLNLIIYSRGYRLLKKYYAVRIFLLPPESKRFYLTKLIFNLPRYVARGYVWKAFQYVFKHGFSGFIVKVKSVLKGKNAPDIPRLPDGSSGERLGGIVPFIMYREPAPQHTESVDVIICVHNAYEDVKHCVESVFEFSSEPFRIIIVDDGSGEQTRDYLASLAEDCPNIRLFRNEQESGYARAANIGLRASTAEYCVLLHSDTIVTTGWLDKMIHCRKSGIDVGIVGPLSNAASCQSILEDYNENWDWAHNELPQDIGVDRFAELVEGAACRLYPNLPLLNGFCLMLHRTVIDSIGYLDEENFGGGFGEEDDYNLRAVKAGFQLALADDTYIFHAQSKSYTDENRLALSKENEGKLRKKHGDALLDASAGAVKDNFVLEGIRARIRIAWKREYLTNSAKERWGGKRILFLLPISDYCEVISTVIQEARIMMKMGIDVRLYNLRQFRGAFKTAYPDLDIPVIYGKHLDSFREYAGEFDLICSTLYNTVRYCDFKELGISTRFVYYIQDFEPCFFEKDTYEYKEAYQSYTACPSMTLITKTKWNHDTVERETGAKTTVISKSVEIDLYRPRKSLPNPGKTVIAAMISPSSSRSAPELPFEILNSTAKKYGEKVLILVFCSEPSESEEDRTSRNTGKKGEQITNLGKLNKSEMVSLLSYADVFVDFSSFQTVGLTAMEAMACGCGVIVPQSGVATEFVVDGWNGIVVDTTNKKGCEQSIHRLVDDYDYLCKLSYNAIGDMCSYFPEQCAYSFLEACFE